MGKNYLERLFTLPLNPNAAARGQYYKYETIYSVQGFDTCGIWEITRVWTSPILGLN